MEQMTLTNDELARYSRHIIIPEFNIEGQKRLKASSVLVVGTGGLGSPLLLYLAAAGVGTIGILDFDIVDDSNLQRQVLFSVDEVGKSKVEAAKERLLGLNPHVNYIIHNIRLSSANALDIIKDYDVVADGTDNFPTRYLVNDACVLLNKPNVYASIFRFDGQVSVFNYQNGPNYRDLYPEPPPPGLVPSCAEGGVLGVLPGIVGSLQANEVIKVLTGIGDTLSGRLFSFDALNFTTRIFKIVKDKTNPLNGENPTQTSLIDYEQFCGIPKEEKPVIEITVQELKSYFDANKEFQLIDVREKHEYDFVNLGAELIPLNTILEHKDKIARDKPVVVHCKGGVRSAKAIRALEEEGFTNLVNLKGGIVAYAKEIDVSMPIY
jgi:adenylyltransferase/sulfurtransferase